MNKKQGFILKPETYNQKEWYELFMNLSKEYRKKCNIINELEKYIKEAIEYINHATIGADSSPIEDSWLYNLYETKHILNKGDNNGRK